MRYSTNITRKDVERAKRAFKEGKYAMSYIDPMRFEVVDSYLSHFPDEPVNTKDILKESLVESIVKKDNYLICAGALQIQNLVPDSFDEVCDFIGSIPSDFV